MENMNNSLMIASQVMETGMSYSSISTDSAEGKARLYNAASNPTHKLKDNVNTRILMRDVVVELAVVNNEDGEQVPAPRVVIIDDDGDSYASVSVGLYNSLKRLFALFGTPDMWDAPLPIIPKLVSTKKGQVLTLEVAV